MSAGAILVLVVFFSILVFAIVAAVVVVMKAVKRIRRNLRAWAEKGLQTSESAPPVSIKPTEFWRLEEQRAYAKAVEKSQGLRIAPSDSPEEKARKKAERVAVWTEHDAKKAQILLEEVYQKAVQIGQDFFRGMEADPDAIGWTWQVRSGDEVCEQCKSLEGSYRKGIRIPYPAHIGCRCSLSVVYKLGRKVQFREYRIREVSP